MWKKEETQKRTTTPGADRPPSQEQRQPGPQGAERATIGRSITIKGEVTGDEDLLIQGRVEGSVDLKQHSVTVGPEGEVKADISGRVITVEGVVDGNLAADEQVILRDSARLQGDITAPRVMLEDGAYFRGSVEMTEAGRRGETQQGRRTAGPSLESGMASPAGTAPEKAEGQSGAGGSTRPEHDRA